MPGISINRRKWWHCTLSILNREDNNVIKAFTSINQSNFNSNFDPSIIYAYPKYNINCNFPINIPVPAFDLVLSPGYFLFIPSVEDLGNSIVDVITYQEAINLNKRRTFEFKRYAVYNSSDADCTATFPNSLDTSPYETITNTITSNVFRFPKIPLYDKIGCCQLEISFPSINLPPQEQSARPTAIWYLHYNELNSIYSLYSYDFAKISDALVFRGNINLPSSVGQIYDITWIPLDNSLIALCDTGIFRVFPGNQTNAAFLSNEPIEIVNIPDSESLFPIVPVLGGNPLKLNIEYNRYSNSLYVFTKVTTSGPYFSLIKMNYEFSKISFISQNFFSQINENSDEYEAGVTGLVFVENTTYNPYVIWGKDLCRITSDIDQLFGFIQQINGNNNSLSGMSTFSFAANPDEQIYDNIIYSTNTAGQLFTVNLSDGSAIFLDVSVPANPIGSATTINGQETRVQKFPFNIGDSHWLFMVDISSTMAGIRLPIIKAALIDLLQTYVRYGDKISILWFGDNYGKITKQLNTYSDASEVINYINTYFVTPISGKTNFCAPFSNISQDFTDLKNIIILSDGTFDDCETDWRNNIKNSIASIKAANSGIYFTAVAVRTSSGTEKLQAIATDSNGKYVNWN